MNDETLREKYQAVQPVGDYGIPFRPNNLMFFPKALNNATARFPVFSVPDKDKPYQYTETIKTIKVTRFYVKHHPKGYKPEHEEYGDGSETNPFLDFKNACSKIDCFLNNSCRGKVQIIIMEGSSPLDSSCSHHFVAPLRVILGATDGQLYFEVSEDCEFAVKMISQSKAAKDTSPTIYPRRIAEEVAVFRKRGINNPDPIFMHGRFVTGSIGISIEHEKYKEFFSYGNYFLPMQGELTSEELIIDKDYSSYTIHINPDTIPFLGVGLRRDAEDNLVVSWQDGQITVFVKKNDTVWELPGVFHAPNLREYHDCTITAISEHDYDLHIKYKDQRIVKQKTPALWYFVNAPEDGEWTSAGGAIYTEKNGKPDEYVTTADLFLRRVEGQKLKLIFWMCEGINISDYRDEFNIVASECKFINNQVNHRYALFYKCELHDSSIYGVAADRCSSYDSSINTYTISRSEVSHSDTQLISARVYYCNVTATNHIEFADVSFTDLCHSHFTITARKRYESLSVLYVDTCTFNITYAIELPEVCISLSRGGFCYNTDIKVSGKLETTVKEDTWVRYESMCNILVASEKEPIISNVTVDDSEVKYILEQNDNSAPLNTVCVRMSVHNISLYYDYKYHCISGCTTKQWGGYCDY